MKNSGRLISTAAAVVALAGSLAFVVPAAANAATTASESNIEQGRALAFNRKEGNCLACHVIPGGQMPGNVGPALVSMKARFPNRQKLFAQIWDPRGRNPHTIMPPFGANRILTKSQINKIIDFLYTH